LRAVGRVAELTAQVDETGAAGNTGISHTRWATHGVPCERNAHPHISGGLAVVHNGIIENHEVLRARLRTEGYVFRFGHRHRSRRPPDRLRTQEVPRLLRRNTDGPRATAGRLRHRRAARSRSGHVIVAREGAPLLLGLAEDGNYAASDVSALLQVTRRIVYLENGDCAELTRTGYRITRFDGTPVERAESESQLSADAVELGQYRHYMQKEMFEQPVAISNTLEMLGTARSIQPGLFGANTEACSRMSRRC
jgi:glucosamine--fructose-6-phosphate aminotransferase (isomerizing)